MSNRKPKVLVVSRPGLEYTLDLVVHGLSQLGCKVVDLPRKEIYQKDSRKHMVGFSLPVHGHSLDWDSDFDFCLMGNFNMYLKERGMSIESYGSVMYENIKRYIIKNKIPIAVFNAEDNCVDFDETWGNDFGELIVAEFLRELPKSELEDKDVGRVRKRMLLSLKEDVVEEFNENPVFTSFCAFSEHGAVSVSRAKRRMVYDYLVEKDNCVSLLYDRTTYSAYLKMLQNSWSAISVRGGGWDSIRYWETSGMGSLLISEDVGKQIHIENNFVHEIDSFLFDFEFDNSFEDIAPLKCLDKFLDKIENNKDLISKMRKEGQKKVMDCHTTTKRASYMLGILEDLGVC